LSKFGLGLDEEAAQAQGDIGLRRAFEVVAVRVDRGDERESGVGGRERHAASLACHHAIQASGVTAPSVAAQILAIVDAGASRSAFMRRLRYDFVRPHRSSN
jgi:hypothetical protein